MKKKNSFPILTSGKFLEALGGEIGTGSIFCLSFSLSNRVYREIQKQKMYLIYSQEVSIYEIDNKHNPLEPTY